MIVLNHNKLLQNVTGRTGHGNVCVGIEPHVLAPSFKFRIRDCVFHGCTDILLSQLFSSLVFHYVLLFQYMNKLPSVSLSKTEEKRICLKRLHFHHF